MNNNTVYASCLNDWFGSGRTPFICKSTDNGISWDSIPLGTFNINQATLTALDFKDNLNGKIVLNKVGDFYTSQSGIIINDFSANGYLLGDAFVKIDNSVLRDKYDLDIKINKNGSNIFNADGSFNPKELITMYKNLTSNKIDFIFASRYEQDCSSEDDTLITYIGNFIFTKIGNIFFNLKITDILYTFVIGKVDIFKKLDIENKDFSFCVELPIKACKSGYTLATSKSNERARIGGRKKVNAFKDGLLILISMFKLFFKVKK